MKALDEKTINKLKQYSSTDIDTLIDRLIEIRTEYGNVHLLFHNPYTEEILNVYGASVGMGGHVCTVLGGRRKLSDIFESGEHKKTS